MLYILTQESRVDSGLEAGGSLPSLGIRRHREGKKSLPVKCESQPAPKRVYILKELCTKVS